MAGTLPVVREAGLADLAGLCALERACFPADAQTRRSLRWLLTRANARLRVVDDGSTGLSGCTILLFRRGSRVARLYSIAVAPAARGRGLARALLTDAMTVAVAGGAHIMRAEARASNTASRGVFAAGGFAETQRLPAYYPGPEDGIRMARELRGE